MKRLLLTAVAALALLIPVASASAAPKGEYVNFAQCPLSNPALDACIFSKSTGGEVKTGAKTVPVANPQVLQGGLEYLEGDVLGKLNFLAATNGKTLVPTPRRCRAGCWNHGADLVAEIHSGLVQRPDQRRLHRRDRNG